MSFDQSFALPIPSDTRSVSYSTSISPSYARKMFDGSEVSDLLLHSTLQAIGKLRSYTDNWDGHGSVKPRAASITQALTFARIFRVGVIEAGYQWVRPYISANEDGNVVFEWWHADKKLTIYVRGPQVTYIKVWGINIDSEMEDGRVSDHRPDRLWNWLHTA